MALSALSKVARQSDTKGEVKMFWLFRINLRLVCSHHMTSAIARRRRNLSVVSG